METNKLNDNEIKRKIKGIAYIVSSAIFLLYLQPLYD
jgi:hypothetical protein